MKIKETKARILAILDEVSGTMEPQDYADLLEQLVYEIEERESVLDGDFEYLDTEDKS